MIASYGGQGRLKSVSLKNKRVFAHCIWPGASFRLRQGFNATWTRDYFCTPIPGQLFSIASIYRSE
jgi:hypothetical protein